MAEGLDLGSFNLFGGDTPSTPSVPSGGFDLFGAGGGGGVPTGSYGLGAGSLDTSGIPGGSLEAGAPSGGGSGGWFGNLMGGLGKTLDPIAGFAKNIGPIAQLGTAGAGIASSIMGMNQGAKANQALGQSMQTQRDISRAVLPEATKLTTAGGEAMLGGPLPEGIQAQVDAWKQKATAEMNSYLVNAGIASSTEQAKWQAYIEQQGYLMGQQLASGLYGQGLQGLGVAGGSAGGLASTAGQMSAGVPQAISGANKALAQLAAQG
jgi:hypothetical protein